MNIQLYMAFVSKEKTRHTAREILLNLHAKETQNNSISRFTYRIKCMIPFLLASLLWSRSPWRWRLILLAISSILQNLIQTILSALCSSSLSFGDRSDDASRGGSKSRSCRISSWASANVWHQRPSAVRDASHLRNRRLNSSWTPTVFWWYGWILRVNKASFLRSLWKGVK